MVNNIVVIGAGGHCRDILSILQYYKQFHIIGIADRDTGSKGEEIAGNFIKYSWGDLAEIYKRGTKNAVIAVGDNKERKKLFLELSGMGFMIPTIIHPTAIIEKDAVVGEGSVICMGAKIGTKASIGRNCVVYTGSILDHEVQLGDHSYVSPGSNIAGRVVIGEGSFIGMGSTIKERITIGNNVVVGAGSVVIKDIPDNVTVAGVPAKHLR